MAINVQDIVTEYGAYYIQGGQNEQRLKRLLFGVKQPNLQHRSKQTIQCIV